MEWRPGPDFSHNLRGMGTVPFNDTFLVVSGLKSTTYSIEVITSIFEFQYQPPEDDGNSSWKIRSEELRNGRFEPGAIFVSNKTVPCFGFEDLFSD